jgi:TRAP-type mannitol/chloroaromatic compound transport system substrate-binding protein
MINLDAWNALSDQQQAMVEYVCGDNVRDAIAMGESMQAESLEFFESEGVEIREWSPEILSKLKEAWQTVAAREAEKDQNFARTWQSMEAFRADYAKWRDLGYLDR